MIGFDSSGPLAGDCWQNRRPTPLIPANSPPAARCSRLTGYPSAGSKRLIAITTVTRVPRSADVRQPICFLPQRPSIVAFLSWGVGNNWLV